MRRDINSKGVQVVCLSMLAFLAGCAVQGSKYEATPGAAREAVAKGEAREFLSVMETQAAAAEANHNWHQAASAYNAATFAAWGSGQMQKALSYGGKALELAVKAKNQELQLQAIQWLAYVHTRLGQNEKSREWAEKGIEGTKKLPAGPSREGYEGLFYRLMGIYFLQTGNPQKAIENLVYSRQVQQSRLDYYTKVRAHAAIPMGAHHLLLSLTQLGRAYQRTGNVQEAIETYENGLNIIRRFKPASHVEGNFYLGLGRLYLTQKDFSRASENLKKALEMGNERDLAELTQSASHELGNLYRQMLRPADAADYYQKAIKQVESIRSVLQSEEYRRSYFEGALNAYVGMIDALVMAEKWEEAFNYSERARSRAFLDILGSKVQLASSDGLLQEERALQARVNALQARMIAQEEEGSLKGPVGQELQEAERAYDAFLAKVRKENKEQASLMNVEPLTLKQVQELLDPGVSLLEYFVMEDQLLLWIVEKDRANSVRLSLNRSELISKITALRDSIQQVSEKGKLGQASEDLYRALVEPALPHIKGKQLLIIPHDVMHYLPFQALVSPQGKYLIQDFPIYYLSSASLMQFTREKKRASREKVLALGNPDLGDPAYALRFAEREVKEVAAAFPKSAVYVRGEATKQRAVSSSPGYDILHFAVHGELKEDDPLGSGLLLASEGKGDGKLSVAEIFSLNLKADTVVLSACETGLGQISGGDEVIGLTRSFIYAGTPSVVTTLWKVNDRASYELMREFYSNLKTMKKSEALRQAQLKTMQEFPEPFFWAAYGLTGEP